MLTAAMLLLAGCVVSAAGWAATARRLARLRAAADQQSRQHHLASAVLRGLSNSLLLVDRNGRTLVSEEAPTWFDDDLRTELLERARQALGDGLRRTYRFTHRQRAYSGDVFPLGGCDDAVAVLVRESSDADGSVAKLQRLAARNEAILRSAMDGFFIVDQEYRFTEVNEAFCRMTGYSEAELLQLRITDMEISSGVEGTAPIPLRTGLHQFAAAHRHRAGHTIFLENSVFVLHDDGRKILVGFARDITEFKRHHEEIDRLHRQNKLLLNSVGEGIFGVDRDGRVTFVNASAMRLLGWTLEELLGEDLHGFLYEPAATGSRDHSRCAICTATQAGAAHRWVEAAFRTRDGGSLTVEFSSTSITEGEQSVGAVIVFQDISERKRAESERERLEGQIRQAQKLESLGLLAGGIAHDFNNVLVGILGNAFLALEQLAPDSSASVRIQRIVNAAQRASKIIQQIRAYSGRLSKEVTELDLNELVEETIDLVRTGIHKSVRLITDLQPDLSTLPADSGQVQQIIMNLLINAGEAVGDRGGAITVRTRLERLSASALQQEFAGQAIEPGEFVRLEVRDDGCGMDSATLARVFDPFFSSKELGRGLGLAAVRGIVHAHFGGIRIHSRVGAGTTVSLVLPRGASVRPAPPPARADGALPENGTVLVIDDEPDIREIVRSVLERRGLRVLTAEDGASGLRAIRESGADVDVVLLDMNMPGMSGVETYEELARLDGGVRVIFSSGYGQREALSGFGESPAISFLQKPYTMDELVSRVGAAVRARQSERAIRA